MRSDAIAVRTHVGRDLLQSAALFKTEMLVVWEYVANSLQYVDAGTVPRVEVTLGSGRKEIRISDNGRGMDREGLRNFFLMHGENLDRLRGQKGRGRFGTGKSAAFGIAGTLRVETTRDGRLNSVELRRRDIEGAGASDIPVLPTAQDMSTAAPNGTTIIISDLRLKRLNVDSVIRYVERHLARWPGKPSVIINGHVCEANEPAIAYEERCLPPADSASLLGGAELVIKVAKIPLEPDQLGVGIFASGSLLETTLAGAEGQPMSQYICGEIDVPSLDDDDAPIPAYDMSRSMQLNRSNETVMVLLSFIGVEVDRVRRKLVKEDQQRRTQEQVKALAREASKIAELINQDFLDFSDRIERVHAKNGRGPDNVGDLPVDPAVAASLIPGSETPAEETTQAGECGHGNGEAEGGTAPPRAAAVLKAAEDGQAQGRPAGGPNRRRQVGGFSVEFRSAGAEASRAQYVRSDRTIYVNLDHPQIAAAKGAGSMDEPVFRRLAYEVAFIEYAIALASERDAVGHYFEPSDAISEIRETLNRMACRAAHLYA